MHRVPHRSTLVTLPEGYWYHRPTTTHRVLATGTGHQQCTAYPTAAPCNPTWGVLIQQNPPLHTGYYWYRASAVHSPPHSSTLATLPEGYWYHRPTTTHRVLLVQAISSAQSFPTAAPWQPDLRGIDTTDPPLHIGYYWYRASAVHSHFLQQHPGNPTLGVLIQQNPPLHTGYY